MPTQTQTHPTDTIRSGSPADLATAKEILLAAFADDPPVRWMYPDLQQYRACFPQLVEAFAGRAFTNGGAFFAGDDQGAALWFPPGVDPDEQAVGTMLGNTVGPERLPIMEQVFEQMDRFHMSEPHWYLPLTGVRRVFHGQGLGGALLEHVLSICDRDRLPGYLEATSTRNAALYQRFGFEHIGEIRVEGFPTLYPMKRAITS